MTRRPPGRESAADPVPSAALPSDGPLSDDPPASDASTLGSGADARWIWRLAATNPQEVLRRLVDHDALHLQAAVQPRLNARALILDPERVFVRTAARVAYRAVTEAEPSPGKVAEWFARRLDEAIDDCLRQDGQRAARDEYSAEIFDQHAQFHWTFMVPAREVLRAAVAFNGLPFESRRSFFALLIERRSVDDCVAEGLGPRERLRERVLAALDAATGIRGADETAASPALREKERR